jgi:hypothetical protein
LTSFAGLNTFTVSEAGSWLDGDVLFVKEDDAKEQFMSMLSVPDWGRKIAPEEWGIEETEQKSIEEVFASGLDTKLEKINALRGPELLIVIVL